MYIFGKCYRVPSETNWDPLVVGLTRKASLRK